MKFRFLEFVVYQAMLKQSVKITHITWCNGHDGTKLEETTESVEDNENEDIVTEEINEYIVIEELKN